MAWNIELPDAQYFERDDRQLGSIIEEVLDQDVVAIDTETTGLKVWKDQPLFWSLAWGKHRRICMPANTLDRFTDCFKDSTKRWVFANAKFDMHMLANAGIDLAGDCVDTAVMHALLHEEESHSLKDMAKQVLGWRWSDFFDTFKPLMVPDSTKVPKQLKSGLMNQPTRRETIQEMLLRCHKENRALLVDYASNDAYGTLRLYEHLKKELERTNIYSLYPDWLPTMAHLFFHTEVPFTKVLYTCERNGIYVDKPYLQHLRVPMWDEHEKLRREMVRLSGDPNFNPNSVDRLRDYFLNHEGLRPLMMTKGGKSGIKQASIDKGFLEHYENESDMARCVLRDRKLTKLIGTYIDGIDEYTDPRSRIHTRLNQDVARTGRLSSSDPNCFHGDTELLTPAGWVKIKDYAEGVPVAQWAPSGVVTFVRPTAFIRQKADTLIELRNQHIRLSVTEDHRCLLRHRKTRELRVFAGKDYPEDWQQLHAGHYLEGTCSLGDDFVRLLVATQADGHWHGGALDFGFKKARKVERMLELLTRLSVPFAYTPRNSNGRSRFYVPRGEVVDRLHALLGPKKLFGPWLLDLPSEEREVFCAETFFWDGSWTRRSSYSSDNENNAIWVQTLFALTGKRAHFRRYTKTNGGTNYQIDVVERDYSMTTNVERQLTPGPHKVYCVSVPSSYVLVRYDGEIAVTGQCQNIPQPDKDKFQLRGAFQATPDSGNELIVADYAALEMRLLACATATEKNPEGAREMIQIFLDGKDIHMGNAELVFGPIVKREHGWDLTYDFLKESKKIDTAVKEGRMPPEARTDRHALAMEKRNHIKTVSFGMNYGMKEGKLARSLGITKEEALGIIDAYLHTHPAIEGFYADAIKETQETGFSFTLLGRRRFHPAILSNNKMDRWSEERKCVNNQIQGTAADAVRLAMLRLSKANLEYKYGAKMLLQIHDELIFECPKETSQQAKAEIQDIMQHPFPTDLLVPLDVSIATGSAWNKAH